MEDKINSGSSLVDVPENNTQFMQHSENCVLEPPDIFLEDHIMDIKFSPTSNVLALG